MWNINGKQYDLTNFLDKHPGGADILLKTRGEADISALFETYHAFSNKDDIKKSLDKYEIKNDQKMENIVKKYDFTNYDKLIKMVKEKFPNRKSTKITPFRLVVNGMSLILYLPLFYIAMMSRYSLFIRCLSSFFSAILWMSHIFNVMHDASHYGVSIYPSINNTLTKICNGFGLWNSTLWFYHHVHHHHSFTSVSKKDPDIYHFSPFIRKTNISNRYCLLTSKNQGNIMVVLPYFTIFPGVYYGQALMYIVSAFNKKVFSIKLPNITFYDTSDMIMMTTTLYFLYNGLFLPTILYMITCNTIYHINVAFDHDTYETAIENHYEGDDWLRMQIQNSGNFINDNLLWTYMFGAINYQIEHHIFPNMSSIHYPTVKPFVVEYCKQHNIPYVHHSTIYGAYKSYLKMLDYNKCVD
jgi:linoleoyl-CoA desaturase